MTFWATNQVEMGEKSEQVENKEGRGSTGSGNILLAAAHMLFGPKSNPAFWKQKSNAYS